MTRKKFMEHCMAHCVQRNDAKRAARMVQDLGISYGKAYSDHLDDPVMQFSVMCNIEWEERCGRKRPPYEQLIEMAKQSYERLTNLNGGAST